MFVVIKTARGLIHLLLYLAGHCETGPWWTRRLKRAVTFATIEDARAAAKEAGGEPLEVEPPKHGWREP